MQYSRKFKERMVRQLVGPNRKSAMQVSKESGVAQSTLSKWLRASVVGVSDEPEGGGKPTAERTWKEKARLVLEADELEGEALGAFLRSNGIHEADLDEWRAWLESGPAGKGEQRQRSEDRKRIKSLERELRKWP